MARGYDVAELLADIEAQRALIARLVPNNFTEAEARLVLLTMCEARDTPDRVQPSMLPAVASVVQKLRAVLDRFETERRAATDFAASLTDEERQLILERRAQK